MNRNVRTRNDYIRGSMKVVKKIILFSSMSVDAYKQRAKVRLKKKEGSLVYLL